MGLRSYIGKKFAEFGEQYRRDVREHVRAYERCFEGTDEEVVMKLAIWDELHSPYFFGSDIRR